MVLIYSLVILMIYHFSLLTFPTTGFLLPIYKIKKLKNLSKNKRLMVEILVIVALFLLSPQLLVLYLVFFLAMEFLYNILKKYNFKEYDRIVLNSFIITIMSVGIIYYNRAELIANFQYIFEIYEKNLNLDLLKLDFSSILYDVKSNLVYYTFIYVFFNIYVLHLYFERENYRKWEISFYWVLLYIIPFFLLKIKIDNFYLKNILEVTKLVYCFYGVNGIYNNLSKIILEKSGSKLFNEVFVLMMVFVIATSIYPYMFIIGVVYSYFYKPDKNKTY